jgi:phosphatidylinositol alpha-1,6-mannosyltransferase
VRLERLAPGVDTEIFHPAVDGSAVRARHRLTGRSVIVCVSRLVPRKGQDALIRALPAIRDRVPDAALLLVGGGRYAEQLRRLARSTGVAEHVRLTGPVPAEELPQHFAAGDVFAMPCRTRRFGLDVEGLGMVFLEASATGLPVLAGNSGGAPDAVRQDTGEVVDGRDIAAIAEILAGLLADPDRARQLGAAGRRWTEQDWQWDRIADRLAELLELS